MIPLSALVALLTVAMALTRIANPEAVPLYAIAAGAVMAAVTYLSARIYVFLRMFNAGYAITFCIFAVGFIVFGNGGLPDWAPGWMQSMEPKPFLALAFTAYAVILLLIARLPLIGETIGLSDSYFTSSDPSRLKGLGFIQLTEGSIGRGFLILIILINFVQTYLLILFNIWQGALFDSFQNRDEAAFWVLIVTFLILAGQWVVFAVVEYLFAQYMLIRWRRHMSRQFVEDWLEDDRHYRIQFMGEKADNPDQRIAEDIRQYVTSTFSIATSMFSTFLTLAAFVQLLWDLSGRFRVEEGSAFMLWITAIPGFLVWVCLAYAVVATVIGHLIGRPLIAKNYHKERTEANFRFGMARMREYSEQVALLDGKRAERGVLFAIYERQVEATLSLVRTTRDLRVFSFSIGQMTDILPYVLVAPAYFAGVGTLGGLQQTAGAFARVQNGFSIFLNLYETLAAYKASVNRINGFREAMDAAGGETGALRPIGQVPTSGPDIAVEDLSIGLPGGRVIGKVEDLRLAKGQSAILTGMSGSGKSTLFRAIAGIWPFGKGRVEVPEGASVMVLPQRPYIPIGSLRAALTYPEGAEAYGAEEIAEAMRAAGLEHLIPRLGDEALWSQALSGGEQQRVAIARANALAPDCLLLDEPTSSLDPGAGAAIERYLLRLSARGRGIVMATHDLNQARRFAEFIVFMHRGRVLETGSTADFFKRPVTDAARRFTSGEWLE
jgi:vitamin B12/bleomycin/antimicrobial peptide transport system ATP-binding/permease protein